MPATQEVQRWLDDVDFPCQKDDLVRHAEDRQAPDEVVAALRALPLAEYTSMDDVTKGIDPS